jgi:iron complex outermembrane receptor protein
VQGQWTKTVSPGNESELRFSYDKSAFAYTYLSVSMQNLTGDFQNRRQAGEFNEIYWGAGFQQYWDTTNSSRMISFDPAQSVYRSGYAVFRDEWQLIPERFLVSAGIRLDYNSNHQLEYQPSLRLLYTPSARQSLWFAASRALRAPNRLDRDMKYEAGYLMDYGFPVRLYSTGNKNQQSEIARSAEAGYRFQSGQRWSVDVSTFFTYFERLRALTYFTTPEFNVDAAGLEISVPMTTGNLGRGRSYGGEIWGMWQVRSNWRLVPSYSSVRDTFWLPATSLTRVYVWDLIPLDLRHQASLRSQVDLAHGLQLDIMTRARSHERNCGLPGAFLVDARLGWRPSRNSEWSIALNNITNRRILEASSEAATPTLPIRRTFLVKWSRRF